MISIKWAIFFVLVAFIQGFFIGAHFAYGKLMKKINALWPPKEKLRVL